MWKFKVGEEVELDCYLGGRDYGIPPVHLKKICVDRICFVISTHESKEWKYLVQTASGQWFFPTESLKKLEVGNVLFK